MMRQSETMRAASRLLLSHPIVCLLAALAAGVVLGVLGPSKVVHAADANLLTPYASSFESVNPSWDDIGWYADSTGGYDNTQALFGSVSYKMDITSAQAADTHGWHGIFLGAETGAPDTVSANTQVVGSAYVKAPVGKIITARIRSADATGAYLGEGTSNSITADGTWQRITSPAATWNQAFRPGVEILVPTSQAALSFNVDGVKVETGTTVTDWSVGMGGGPPDDPYPNPTSTSQTFTEGSTPAANSVHLNPRITCSADPTPANVSNAERGVNIVNQNVVLINPQIKGCSVGILVKSGGFKLLADKSKVGYASAASPALHNNYKGVVFDQGAQRRRAVHEGQLHPH